MQSILKQLYNGDIHPFEDYIPPSAEYKRLDDAFVRASDAFSDKLEAPLAEEYEKIIDAHVDLLAAREMETYIRGMRMGAQLTLELFSSDR